jgi:hypothetical protein
VGGRDIYGTCCHHSVVAAAISQEKRGRGKQIGGGAGREEEEGRAAASVGEEGRAAALRGEEGRAAASCGVEGEVAGRFFAKDDGEGRRRDAGVGRGGRTTDARESGKKVGTTFFFLHFIHFRSREKPPLAGQHPRRQPAQLSLFPDEVQDLTRRGAFAFKDLAILLLP